MSVLGYIFVCPVACMASIFTCLSFSVWWVPSVKVFPYSLIWLHSIESVALDGSITPEDVPVFFFGVGEFHFVGFGHSSNYRVVAVVDVYVQASLLVFRLFLLFLCFHLFCWLLWHLASTFFLLNLSILLFHLLFFLLLVWIVLFIF